MTLEDKFDSTIMRHELCRNETKETIEQCLAIAHDFAVQYAEWCCARAIGVNYFKLNEEELEWFKKEKEL
jgi:hypothetical protein